VVSATAAVTTRVATVVSGTTVVARTAVVSAAAIGDWTTVVTPTTVVATTIVGIASIVSAAIISAVVATIDTNVRIVIRIRRSDVRIGIGRWVAVRGHGRHTISADSNTNSDSANSYTDGHALREDATTS
jgi:hypothetical protein